MVAVCSVSAVRSPLGRSYAHFAAQPAVTPAVFSTEADSFFHNWHLLDLSGQREEKSRVLAELAGRLEARIAGLDNADSASADSPESKLLQARELLADSDAALARLNHFAAVHGIQGVFGQTTDGRDLLAAFEEQLLAEPTSFLAENGAVSSDTSAHLSASGSFFSGGDAMAAMRDFLSFSAAQIERDSSSEAHLALGLAQDHTFTLSALHNALSYIDAAGSDANWAAVQQHLFGAVDESGTPLLPPAAPGFHSLLAAPDMQRRLSAAHALSADDVEDDDDEVEQEKVPAYIPQAGVLVQPINVDFSNVVLDLNDASKTFSIPGQNIAVLP